MSLSWAVWLLLVAFVFFTTVGDVFLARAMTRIGDLGELKARSGIAACTKAVLGSWLFWLAIVNMAASYFSLLTALNWANLSFVGPASSAMTFLANIAAARIFLREEVDRRRWIATALVCVGILLIGIDPPRDMPPAVVP
jgi:drug/metabolite transporter (DMT)-like permease